MQTLETAGYGSSSIPATMGETWIRLPGPSFGGQTVVGVGKVNQKMETLLSAHSLFLKKNKIK